MHIYIDESGTFIIPTQRANYISCVAALVIPSGKKEYLFRRFLHLRTSWGSKSDEKKGSSLNEKQVALVIKELAKYDCFVEIWAIDGRAQSEAAITDFKQRQAEKVTEHLGPEHHPDVVTKMHKLAHRIRNMSNQLFVQAFLTTRLCEETLRIGTLFWSQRVAPELGEFVWTIDAKNRSITQAEEMWRTLLLPFLEARSFLDPLGTVDDPRFDYSYLDKLAVTEKDVRWKDHFEWLRGIRRFPEDKYISAIDLKAIFRNMAFADSKHHVGLQLADIVANAFHRACKGTLQKEGWKDLGSLFILRRDAVVNLVALAPDIRTGPDIPVEDEKVAEVLVTIRDGARSMSPA